MSAKIYLETSDKSRLFVGRKRFLILRAIPEPRDNGNDVVIFPLKKGD